MRVVYSSIPIPNQSTEGYSTAIQIMWVNMISLLCARLVRARGATSFVTGVSKFWQCYDDNDYQNQLFSSLDGTRVTTGQRTVLVG